MQAKAALKGLSVQVVTVAGFLLLMMAASYAGDVDSNPKAAREFRQAMSDFNKAYDLYEAGSFLETIDIFESAAKHFDSASFFADDRGYKDRDAKTRLF